MKSITDKQYLLEKFPGKGGWTFARIPEIKQNKNNPFGWVTVKGSIDGVPFEKYKLMPMGNGQLFLPVNAALRKKIAKQAGDYIIVSIYPDDGPLELPDDLLTCLKDEPTAYENFMQFKESFQKEYLDWIKAAKKESTRIDRIAITVSNASKGLTRFKTKQKD
ncbi:MAG: YdeI/OmpD-associated family protein [Sediminibacterium sp.]